MCKYLVCLKLDLFKIYYHWKFLNFHFLIPPSNAMLFNQLENIDSLVKEY